MPYTPLNKITFTNSAPGDKEWTAHINLLNQWIDPERYLREIIQYARSGKHYPADMHVDLINQIVDAAVKEAIEKLPKLLYHIDAVGKDVYIVNPIPTSMHLKPEDADMYIDKLRLHPLPEKIDGFIESLQSQPNAKEDS